MIGCLSIVETDKVIHIMESDIVKLVVEIESFGISSDEFDKETRSSNGLQPKQADLSCVHALNVLHLNEIRVVPRGRVVHDNEFYNELFTPYKEPEREFRSSRRHFKSLSLDKLRSPDFNLFSDQENSEEEESKAMAETMEQYMSKTRTDYRSGVARPKIEEKDSFELKGQFLKEL
ncbi:hypothetical protein Tco_0120917 [Tanacetum coccineum]